MKLLISGLISESLGNRLGELVRWFCAREKIETEIHVSVSLNGTDNGWLKTRQNFFEIWLNKALSIKDLEKSLFHELWHLKQIVSQRLRQLGKHLFFDGVPVTESYLYQKHEIEARKIGLELFLEWSLTFGGELLI